MPYGTHVQKALGELGSLDIETICPSHGEIWRRKTDIETIISLYDKWANHVSERRVCIVYDTMWHSTEALARKLYELLDQEAIPTVLMSLKTNELSDILAEIIRSKVIAVGSPILNNKIFPSVGALLTYLEGLKPKNRFGFTFGSYGWSTAGFKALEDSLKAAGLALVSEGKYFQYVPRQAEMDQLKEVLPKIKAALDRQ